MSPLYTFIDLPTLNFPSRHRSIDPGAEAKPRSFIIAAPRAPHRRASVCHTAPWPNRAATRPPRSPAPACAALGSSAAPYR
eukprot:scaffold53993_cov57-Phaeocystis_antarctica.AAC.1